MVRERLGIPDLGEEDASQPKVKCAYIWYENAALSKQLVGYKGRSMLEFSVNAFFSFPFRKSPESLQQGEFRFAQGDLTFSILKELY